VFRGGEGGRFTEVSPRGATAELLAGTSRGAAFGDIDDDGDIDVLVCNRDLGPHLLLNEAPRRGAWIGFRVLDRRGSDAIGATVAVELGKRRLSRDVRAAFSYLTANDLRVHFGLGDVAPGESTVRWPDGHVESFGELATGAYHVLQRGRGEERER
jgi:enediyne biosynthesis protein E4